MGNYNQYREDMDADRPEFHFFRKLKQKFKKGLFGFFKDEIMQATTHLPFNQPTYIEKQFTTPIYIKAEKIISPIDRLLQPNDYEQRILHDLKQSIFNECMKHVNIEKRYDIDDYLDCSKTIRISLYIVPGEQ